MSKNRNLSDLNITVVGLGLMGGSLVRALHQHVHQIVAVDPDNESIELAYTKGVISHGTSDLKTGVADADIIILATPVSLIIDILGELAQLRPEGCFVMDLGSTKVEIAAAMSELPDSFEAIGGHPMCGREFAGFEASSPDLYDGQTFILCRNQRTSPRAEELAIGIVETIHSQPLFLDARLHDEIVALTSHVPYLLASMLTTRVAEEAMSDRRYWQISATGLKDVTRLTGSNPHMMLDILKTNRDLILDQLHILDVEIQRLNIALENDDFGQISDWLQEAWQQHDSYLEHRWRGSMKIHSKNAPE